MFPAEALPATWMEDQFKIWEDRILKESVTKAEAEAKVTPLPLPTHALGQAQILKGGIDAMPSSRATSAFFGWCSPMLGRLDSPSPNFSLAASSAWKSPNMSAIPNWGSLTPRSSTPANATVSRPPSSRA